VVWEEWVAWEEEWEEWMIIKQLLALPLLPLLPKEPFLPLIRLSDFSGDFSGNSCHNSNSVIFKRSGHKIRCFVSYVDT